MELNKNNKNDLEKYLQKGGNYKPDFGADFVPMNFSEGERRNSNWGSLFDIVKRDFSNEKAINSLIDMKAEKIIIDQINSSKYKDDLLNNEQLLRIYLHDKKA